MQRIDQLNKQRIFGATQYRYMWHITSPPIRPSILFVIVDNTIFDIILFVDEMTNEPQMHFDFYSILFALVCARFVRRQAIGQQNDCNNIMVYGLMENKMENSTISNQNSDRRR